MKDGVVVVSVTAPPVDGRANEEIVEVIAARLGVKRGAVAIVSGETGKTKIVEVQGLTDAEVTARLSPD